MPAPLTINDNNKSVDAQAGTAIEIHLNGNPSTGHEWMRVGFEGKKSLSDKDLKVSIKYKQDRGGMVGAGGTYKISVTPKHSGQHTVALVYGASYEGPQPDDEFFTVTLNAA